MRRASRVRAPGRAYRPARRQHAARAPARGVRGCPRRDLPGQVSRRCSSCRRCRARAGSPSTACTCSSATDGACRCTRPSTRATVSSATATHACSRGPQERSDGLFDAHAGTELPLTELRGEGPGAVVTALAQLAAARAPGVLAPDAETVADLETIAAGYRDAVAAGVPVVVRCAPAFAGVLAATTAPGLVDAPRARDGVLVVCGSYVPTTTRQLARLAEDLPGRRSSRSTSRSWPRPRPTRRASARPRARLQ